MSALFIPGFLVSAVQLSVHVPICFLVPGTANIWIGFRLESDSQGCRIVPWKVDVLTEHPF